VPVQGALDDWHEPAVLNRLYAYRKGTSDGLPSNQSTGASRGKSGGCDYPRGTVGRTRPARF
jgi:hypothetical protein